MDEKKIEEAASLYAEKYRWEVAISDDEVRNLCRKLFKEGAHWAIQEFLKELWHDASEEPRNKAYILIVDKERDSMVDFFEPNDEDWDHEVELWNIDRWLYIEDLFPKQKGDEK